MAKLLKGAPVAAALNERMQADIEKLKVNGVVPTLAILRVGENGADIAYEKGAMKRCSTVGVEVKNVVLPADVSQDDMLKTLEELNDDNKIHGILIFRPLPEQIDDEAVRRTLKPEKDVDGITDGSLATAFSSKGSGFFPCTAQACLEILDFYGYDVKGMRVTVVGSSLVVGKPAASMLLDRFATVTSCHIFTKDVYTPAKNAEILISAAGKAGLITKEHVSPGQVVIDVGINVKPDGSMCGDVSFEEVEPIVDAITPVPGGVGSVTTSVLVSHVVEAAKKSCN